MGSRDAQVLLVFLIVGILIFFITHEQVHLRKALLPVWVRTTHGVPYGPDPKNRLEIMRPRVGTGRLRPAVVVFHGGGWVGGSSEDMRDRVCRRYLQKGFVVANVDYRLGAIQEAAEDAVRALRWFCGNSATYGVDRSRIVVTGESAGAHLALFAALRSGERIAAIVNFYGVSDIVSLLDRPSIRTVLPSEETESAARRLSPITYVRAGAPPVLSVHGASDKLIPLEQTAILTRAIQQAGGDATEVYIDGAGHGFSAAQQEIAYAAVFGFLMRHRVVPQ